jgi:outer membrane biosynthesis protein TonB
MRARARGFLALFVLAVGLGLAGCDTVDRLQDSVTDLFDTKKKLPGQREPVFPEGVPGVVQGVPPEYLKENTPQEPDPNALATPPEAERPAAEAPPPSRQRAAKPADAEPDSAEAPKEPPAAKPRRRPRQTAEQPRKPAIAPAVPVYPTPPTAKRAPAAPAASAPQGFPAPPRNTPLPWPTAPSQ